MQADNRRVKVGFVVPKCQNIHYSNMGFQTLGKLRKPNK